MSTGLAAHSGAETLRRGYGPVGNCLYMVDLFIHQGDHICVLPRGGGRVACVRYLQARDLRERGTVAEGAARSRGG